MRRKLVVGNWKMHGNLAQNKALLEGYLTKLAPLTKADYAVCVPFPYLYQAQLLLQSSNIAWGAQNIGKFESGAYTGEVSVNMLNDFASRYVIVGHSERNTAYCESDENIAAKFMMAKNKGITPILCVGETLIEREAGVMHLVVAKQLDTIIELYGASVFENAVISYEPIWAIGTGLAASPEQAQNMHEFIRNKISVLDLDAANSLKILYGGSLNPQNALQLLVMPDIDGGLIGRCSLNANDFEGICRAAHSIV